MPRFALGAMAKVSGVIEPQHLKAYVDERTCMEDGLKQGPFAASRVTRKKPRATHAPWGP